MEDNIFDNIHEVDLKKTMETSYIDYAMSVIAARALPDVRDGLKPVQRRVLYSMIELSNTYDKPHRKCARIVGDTMGKYHPHGDASIYDAMVVMAQDFKKGIPLVDGHGNFGSIEGDGAAAMRYTEARLAKVTQMAFLSDLDKDTVDFKPNFDETEKEPTVLPSRYPNLLVNGTTGIAVGMATNMPPHNLKETIDAVIKVIDNKVAEDRNTEIEEILSIIKGPDFPTGGEILGTRGIEEAYRTGRGKIKVRAVTNIEPMANGKNRIIVSELPYMVNKARLIEKIAGLVRDKRVVGITDLRDESNREGMRICIELRKDVNPNVVLNQLYKHTELQDTFGVNMLALVDNQPKILNILEILEQYLKYQEEVVTRRTRFDLNKAEERAHILEGYLIALDHIDEVIELIKASRDAQSAKLTLMERFSLTDAQAQAIVDMRLRALTGLEREKLENEYAELKKTIDELKAILADEKLLLGVIKDELSETSRKYSDERRTKIGYDDSEIADEDMIPKSNVVITMTKLGYIKRMSIDNFRAQNRGGRGIKGLETIDDDYIKDLMMTTSHHTLLFFTNLGRVYKMKAFEIPEAGRTARGTAIINLLQLQPQESITSVIPIDDFSEEKYLFMATKKGIVKKTPTSEYANIRKTGIQAIGLRDDDQLIEVQITDNNAEVLMVSRYGQCIRFKETDVRSTGRTAMGVIGMTLDDLDEVVSMQTNIQGEDLLVVAECGIGKRTKITDFSLQNRGGKGAKCYKIMEKTGYVVGAVAVSDEDEVMMITTAGIIIRMKASGISQYGRVTSGVKLVNLDKDVFVASVAKVVEDKSLYTDEELAKMAEEEAENVSVDVIEDGDNSEESEE